MSLVRASRASWESLAFVASKAAQPLVNQRHRNRGVVERIDTYVELMAVRSFVSIMRMAVEKWQSAINGSVGGVTIQGLCVAPVRVVRRENSTAMPFAADDFGQYSPARTFVERSKSLDRLTTVCGRGDTVVVAWYKELAATELRC